MPNLDRHPPALEPSEERGFRRRHEEKRKLTEGPSEGDLLEDYPHLTKEDIRAAVAYGAASVAHEEVVLLSDTPVVGNS